MRQAKQSQEHLILEYFKNHAGRDIKHAEVVDWATAEYGRRLGPHAVFRDPDRAIRKLSQQGVLTKVGKGVYRYDGAGEHVRIRVLEDFDASTRIAVLQRDGYRCVICGRGSADGVELHVDHRTPKDKGGSATVENGQTLCAQHNFQKKNYDCTEFGHRLFQRWRDTARRIGDQKLERFCTEVLDVFERFGHLPPT